MPYFSTASTNSFAIGNGGRFLIYYQTPQLGRSSRTSCFSRDEVMFVTGVPCTFCEEQIIFPWIGRYPYHSNSPAVLLPVVVSWRKTPRSNSTIPYALFPTTAIGSIEKEESSSCTNRVDLGLFYWGPICGTPKSVNFPGPVSNFSIGRRCIPAKISPVSIDRPVW